jgi:hypothetical protein
MKLLGKSKSLSFNALILGIILLGVIIQQYVVYCQIGFSYDSFDYAFAAKTFREKGILLNFNGSPYIERGILFPLILALLGKNAILITCYLNAAFLFLTSWIWYVLGTKCIQNKILLVLYVLVLTFGIDTLTNHIFLWSEPIFSLLFSLHFLFLHQYFDKHRGYTWKGLCWLTVLGFLCCLQRNPSIFFVFATSLMLFFRFRKNFVGHSIIYVLGSLSGWVLWTWHCLSIKGTSYHGAYESAFRYVWVNLYDYTNALTAWFLPYQLPVAWRVGILGLILLVGMWFHRFSWQKFKSINPFCKSLLGHIGIYFVVLVNLENVGYHEAARYLSVVYPLGIFLLFWVLDNIYRANHQAFFRRILLLMCILWVLYPVARVANYVQMWHHRNCEQMSNKHFEKLK